MANLELRKKVLLGDPVLTTHPKDKSHKLCVYSRLGDFLNYNVQSGRYFTEIALNYTTRTLM
uniref:Uncharacterized protein n=1 Tax=Ditylenchus dipsaci TaxID=166011 RepID=A0A915CT59_9BILA